MTRSLGVYTHVRQCIALMQLIEKKRMRNVHRPNSFCCW